MRRFTSSVRSMSHCMNRHWTCTPHYAAFLVVSLYALALFGCAKAPEPASQEAGMTELFTEKFGQNISDIEIMALEEVPVGRIIAFRMARGGRRWKGVIWAHERDGKWYLGNGALITAEASIAPGFGAMAGPVSLPPGIPPRFDDYIAISGEVGAGVQRVVVTLEDGSIIVPRIQNGVFLAGVRGHIACSAQAFGAAGVLLSETKSATEIKGIGDCDPTQ